jgi:hypothetical protein
VDSPNESTSDNESKTESARIADAVTPWFLLGLATLAAAGAIIRVIGDGGARLVDRLDQTTLLYLAVSAALLMLRRVKTLSFGSYKLEMLEQIRERQIKTEDLLKHINSKLLPLLLPEPERNHLLNLYHEKTDYKGGEPVQVELRRLLAAKLLKKRKDKAGKDMHISDLKKDRAFDLADYVELTPSGEEWVKFIIENEAAGSPPAGKPVDDRGGSKK